SRRVTCGDGGDGASSDAHFGAVLRRFGDKGYDRLSTSNLLESFATNYRMSEPQAAVAAAQLSRLEKIAAKRAKLGNLLSEKIQGAPGIEPHGVAPTDGGPNCFFFLRLNPKPCAPSKRDLPRPLP